MLYLGVSLILIVMGFLMYFLTYFMPIFRLVYFDWIALVMLVIPTMILFYSLSSKRLMWFLERVPKNKMLVLFLRRDGDIIPVLGKRAYPGESFIDIPKLGLIHDLGNVHRIGYNNVRFALENVNHTVDPHYANFTSWLYKIGFNNIRELQATLNGKFPEKVEEVEEKIPYYKAQPVEVLVDELVNTTEELPKAEETKKEEKKPTIDKKFIDLMRKRHGS